MGLAAGLAFAAFAVVSGVAGLASGTSDITTVVSGLAIAGAWAAFGRS